MSDPIEEALKPPETVEDAANAAVDVAMTTLDWQGVTVTVPPNLEAVDPDAIEALENGRAVTGLRGLIGSDEYDRARKRFEKRHGRAPTLVDVAGDESESSEISAKSLAGIVGRHFGFVDAGE